MSMPLVGDSFQSHEMKLSPLVLTVLDAPSEKPLERKPVSALPNPPPSALAALEAMAGYDKRELSNIPWALADVRSLSHTMSGWKFAESIVLALYALVGGVKFTVHLAEPFEIRSSSIYPLKS